MDDKSGGFNTGKFVPTKRAKFNSNTRHNRNYSQTNNRSDLDRARAALMGQYGTHVNPNRGPKKKTTIGVRRSKNTER